MVLRPELPCSLISYISPARSQDLLKALAAKKSSVVGETPALCA